MDQYGIRKVVEMAMKDIDAENNREYHISFDIDALDRFDAPSTGYACMTLFISNTNRFFIPQWIYFIHIIVISVPGGLTMREALCAMETIYESGRLTGVDIVEVNPEIGTDADAKRTVESAIALLKASCGTTRSGDLPFEATDMPRPN